MIRSTLVLFVILGTAPSFAALGPFWGRADLIKQMVNSEVVANQLDYEDITSIVYDKKAKNWTLSGNLCTAVIKASAKKPAGSGGSMIIGATQYNFTVVEEGTGCEE